MWWNWRRSWFQRLQQRVAAKVVRSLLLSLAAHWPERRSCWLSAGFTLDARGGPSPAARRQGSVVAAQISSQVGMQRHLRRRHRRNPLPVGSGDNCGSKA